MYRYVAMVVLGSVIFSMVPMTVSAQTTVRKSPRKYDKLLTAVESFAKLNAQIEIREKEFYILAPFVEQVKDYATQLKTICDMKCAKSVDNHNVKLKKFSDGLYEAHRRYLAMTPNITGQNQALMSEIKRVEFLPAQLSKEKAIKALNQLDLEKLFHYKDFSKTYHSADKAMPSLAPSADLTAVITSFASTTERLAKMGRTTPQMTTTITNLKSKIPDIRAKIKTLEDKRKAIVCTATLKENYSVDIKCLP